MNKNAFLLGDKKYPVSRLFKAKNMNRFIQYSFQNMVKLVYKGYGLDVFGMYKWLLSTMSWSPQQKNKWQLERLGNILEFAWKHVPFYKEYWGDHGVEFFRPRDMEELKRYPILTKDVFRANAKNIRPDNLNSIRHRCWNTGGTTGQPVQYFRDLKQWVLAEAFHLWGWSQLGYVFGDPVGVIAGGSLVPERMSIEDRVRAWMHRRLFLYGVVMNKSIARDYYEKLRKHGTKFLYGYPSAIYLFGKYIAEKGLYLRKLKAVVTTAEMLLPQYRRGIESTLDCRVFDNLGCNDGGYEAYECLEHRGFHYNDLQSVLEVDSINGSDEGQLIITNLWNRSTPFIRYENGDLVKLSDRPCHCACSFPIISSIQGRTADIISFSNGTSLSGPALTLIFRDMEIDGWQVVQTGANRIEVRICCFKKLKPEYVDFIKKVFRQHLSNGVEIVIKRTDKLETTKGGKLKPVWSEIATNKNTGG